jgi:hypothetical protein
MHAPPEQAPTAWWQPDGGELHTLPMQGSALQSPDVASHPATHGVSVWVNEHVPGGVWQAPAENARDVFVSAHVGAFVQATVEPLQVPLPSHWSFVVQVSPSMQTLPGLDGWYVQAPLVGSHVPAAA